jgi:hypothetical protein
MFQSICDTYTSGIFKTGQMRDHSNPSFTEYFDDVEWRKYFVEPHIPGFANFTQWEGKKVLEIGCGIGTDTVNFCKVHIRQTIRRRRSPTAQRWPRCFSRCRSPRMC